MTHRQRLVTHLLLFVLLGGLVLSATANNRNENTIVGAWERRRADDPIQVAMAIFHDDGTFSTSGADPNKSNSLGVWEKIGPTSFVAKAVGFVATPNGTLRVDTRVTIELSRDGQSYVSEGQAEIRLPDGTLIDTVPVTLNATRLTID